MTLLGSSAIAIGTPEIYNPTAIVAVGNGTSSENNPITYTPTGRVDISEGTIFKPDTVLVLPREFIYLFYFVTINSDGFEAPLILNGSNYSDYNNFISSGILPLADQTVSVSDSTASVTVVKTIDQLDLIIDVVNRPIPIVNNPFYIVGVAEIWSRFVDSKGNIPASRRIDILTRNVTADFTFAGGNPGNRTYAGILQPNGFYRSIFNINLPLQRSLPFETAGNASFYMDAKVFPYSVAPSADIIIYT